MSVYWCTHVLVYLLMYWCTGVLVYSCTLKEKRRVAVEAVEACRKQCTERHSVEVTEKKQKGAHNQEGERGEGGGGGERPVGLCGSLPPHLLLIVNTP